MIDRLPDDAAAERLLRGGSAAPGFEGVEALISRMRSSADADVVPSQALAALLAEGFDPATPPAAPGPVPALHARPTGSWRRPLGRLAAASLGVKVLLGAGVASAAVAGASGTGVLPAPVQDGLERVVTAVVPGLSRAVPALPADDRDGDRAPLLTPSATTGSGSLAPSSGASSRPARPTATSSPSALPTPSVPGGRPSDAGRPASPASSAAAGRPGTPARPSGAGRPSDAGRPGDPGRPSGAGRPSDPGRPGGAGRPSQAGRPDQPGRTLDRPSAAARPVAPRATPPRAAPARPAAPRATSARPTAAPGAAPGGGAAARSTPPARGGRSS